MFRQFEARGLSRASLVKGGGAKARAAAAPFASSHSLPTMSTFEPATVRTLCVNAVAAKERHAFIQKWNKNVSNSIAYTHSHQPCGWVLFVPSIDLPIPKGRVALGYLDEE